MKFKDKSLQFWIVQICYIALIALAIVFYQERLASDTSYYFFKSLNSQFFHIEHDRYVLAIAELPVVLFSNLHLPLKYIAIVFSVWHLLFFYIIGFITYKIDKNANAWFLLLCVQTIGIVYGFIAPIFEQFYGTALAVLFYVLLRKYRLLNWPLRIFLMFLFAMVILSHPFNAVLLVFMLAMDFTTYKSFKKYWPFLILIPLYILFKKLNASTYENDKMNWIFDLEHNKTYQLLFQPEHLYLKARFFWYYYKEVIVLFSLTWGYFIWSKQYFKWIVFTLFFFGSLLLINFSYNIEAYSGYYEQVYFLIVPIVVVPFVFEVWNAIKHKTVLLGLGFLSLIMFGYRMNQQVNYAKAFQQKRNLTKQWVSMAQNMPGCKFYIPYENFKAHSQYVDWDMPYYSLLYSAMHGYPKQVTIFPTEEEPNKLLETPEHAYWFRGGELENVSTLNSYYFKLCNSKYSNLYPEKGNE
jgi:hypothetical protein